MFIIMMKKPKLESFGFLLLRAGFTPGEFYHPGAAHDEQQNQAQPKGQQTCLRHVHKVLGRQQIPTFGMLIEIDKPLLYVTERHAIRDDRRVITAVSGRFKPLRRPFRQR